MDILPRLARQSRVGRDGGKGPATYRIIGRDAELDTVECFLRAAPGGLTALVLEGEPGIGKTELWREAVDAARDQGFRILAAQPTPSEATYSFAGLTDLLEETLEEIRPGLPEPQRVALDVALLRAPAPGRGPDGRAVAVAALSSLRALARSGPVLLAIDDLQWLDRATYLVLEFALRRLSTAPVGLLATRRPEGPDSPRPLLGVEATRVARLPVGPLTVGALFRVLSGSVGTRLSRPLLLRIHEASGGNPFVAIEMARALGGGGEPVAGLLPLPESVAALARSRLSGVSRPDRQVLLAVAALARPTLDDLRTVFGPGPRVDGALRRAIDRGLLEAEGRRIRFAHPLLGSVLYGDASAAARQRLHRDLATVLADREERARHLALSTEEPDEAVAAVLEEAGLEAEARGAPTAAGELSEAAAQLTPAGGGEDRIRRLLLATHYHFEGGDAEHAERLVRSVVASAPPGPARARAMLWLERVRRYEAGVDLRLEDALAEAGSDLGLRAEICYALAMRSQDINIRPAGEWARAAVDLAKGAGDRRLLVAAEVAMLAADFLLGKGVDRTLVDLVTTQTEVMGVDPDRWAVSWQVGEVLMWADQLDEARARLAAVRRWAEECGDEGRIPYLLYLLTQVEWRAGNWRRAAELTAEGLAAAELVGQGFVGTTSLLFVQALVDAHLGRVQRAREAATASLVESRRAGLVFDVVADLSVLGFLELSLGDAEKAESHLSEAWALADRLGFRDPGVFRIEPDHIEALVELGRLEQAEEILGPFEEMARDLDRPWALAAAARSRGLLLASRGDVEGSLERFEAALQDHARLDQAFEHGRTLLALGRVRRRSRQKRAARETLQHALRIFDGLGATLWAGRARGELARIGGRAPGLEGLTPTEERVAALAAAGMTNREIGDHLFLTARTVEWNLSRVYRKLQVRSRTELSSRLRSA